MPAYNFRKQFAPLVESGQKRQTIRTIGKRRHARAGEPLQLYTGQRTKACRKLFSPDPECDHLEKAVKQWNSIPRRGLLPQNPKKERQKCHSNTKNA